MVCVADGTELAAEKLERVLTTDPGTGVIRHADAGYDRAIEVADERGVRIPMREQTDDGRPARSSPSGIPCCASGRGRCRPTSSPATEMQTLIDDLIDTMRAANGAGIAANQIGVSVRIAVDRGRTTTRATRTSRRSR